MASARTAILVALDAELAPYLSLIPDLRPAGGEVFARWLSADGALAVIRSDCGPINAVAAAEHTITTFNPTLVLNTGSAGAHNPGLLPGDLVIGDRYVLLQDPLYAPRPLGLCWQGDGERVERGGVSADPRLVARGLQAAAAICAGARAWSDSAVWPAGAEARGPQAIAGTIGSTDTWNTDAGRLERIWGSAGNQSEDMESAYIAQVCALHTVPFLAIRCISNAERHAGTAQVSVTDILDALARAGDLAAQAACELIRLGEAAPA